MIVRGVSLVGFHSPSMKVPPKRKGNSRVQEARYARMVALNESPSEKEGKFEGFLSVSLTFIVPQ